MWTSWYDKQQVGVFQCDVINILDYLALIFGDVEGQPFPPLIIM